MNFSQEKNRMVSPLVKKKADKDQPRPSMGKLCKNIIAVILDGVNAELIEEHIRHVCYK